MSRQQVLSTLRAQRAALHERFGVVRLTLFGSLARDEAVQGRDVDLLVEFDRPVGLFLFLALTPAPVSASAKSRPRSAPASRLRAR